MHGISAISRHLHKQSFWGGIGPSLSFSRACMSVGWCADGIIRVESSTRVSKRRHIHIIIHQRIPLSSTKGAISLCFIAHVQAIRRPLHLRDEANCQLWSLFACFNLSALALLPARGAPSARCYTKAAPRAPGERRHGLRQREGFRRQS